MSGEYVIIIQNKYMRVFRKAEATDRRRAKTLADLGIRESGIFRRMVDKGIFVDAGGAYYMDENEAAEFVAMRRKRAFFTLALMLLVLLFLWIFGGKLFR